MEESTLSIEETNKLRASLGLKPLKVDSSLSSSAEPKLERSADEIAVENYKRQLEESKRQEQAQQVNERLERSRLKREQQQRLSKGRSLGEQLGEDESLDDTANWVAQSRQKHAQLEAANQRRQMEEQQRSTRGEYSAHNINEDGFDASELEGLRVGHDLNDIIDREETILVLKDTSVLDDRGRARITEEEDDDELINLQLVERERIRQNQTARIKKTAYNVYDEMDGVGVTEAKPSLLSQYDDPLAAKQKQSFRLGDTRRLNLLQNDAANGEEGGEGEEEEFYKNRTADRNPLSMDFDSIIQQQRQSDYQSQAEAAALQQQFKKQKRKRQRQPQLRRPVATALLADEHFSGASGNFVDDDDLQQALARSRQQQQQQLSSRKSLKKFETAREIAEKLGSSEMQMDGASTTAASASGSGGLVLSETTEFVKNLVVPSRRQPRGTADEIMSVNDGLIKPLRAVSTHLATEVNENAMEISDYKRDETFLDNNDSNNNSNNNSNNDQQFAVQELIGEPTIDQGLASTLKLLRQKGQLEQRTEEDRKRDELIREHQRWAMKRKFETSAATTSTEVAAPVTMSTSADYSSSTGRRLTRKEEEELRDRQRAKELEEKFRDYKPVINLEYRDEFGRVLNTKEAYKQLSYKFHGKQPGKLKTEKRLRKIAEEMQVQRAENASLKSVETLMERQKEAGSAHLLLSVGSKSSIPFKNPLARDENGNS